MPQYVDNVQPDILYTAYSRLGFKKIPILPGLKAPNFKGWLLPVDHDIPLGYNCGVLLGAASGIVDIDIDSPVAGEVVAYLLKNGYLTDHPLAAFGRDSKPISHLIIRQASGRPIKIAHPETRDVLVELRSDGQQTVFPGSTHPSGEPLLWLADFSYDNLDGPAVDAEWAEYILTTVGVAVLLVDWWEEGVRNDLSLYIAGYLLKAGMTVRQVEAIITAAATTAGDEDLAARQRNVLATQERIDQDLAVAGWSELETMLSAPALAAVQRAVDYQLASATQGPADALIAAITEAGYRFKYNLVREQIELADGSVWHDGELAKLLTTMYDQGFRSKQWIIDFILRIAWDNQYDPIADCLDSLVWDGQDHIAALAACLADPYDPFEYADGSVRSVVHTWLYRWLTGAVARAYGQNVQNPMLTLVADQGLGKSELARWLGSILPEYCVESSIDPNNKDHKEWTSETLIWEVAELGATTRHADVEALKGFLFRHIHTFRKAYGRNALRKTARASYIGTINDDDAGFLTDITGSRRFLVVELTKIDWLRYTTTVNIAQLWAQAVAIYRDDPDAWQLLPEETAARIQINKQFNVENPLMDHIVDLFELTPNAVPYTDAPFTPTVVLMDTLQPKVRFSSGRALQMEIARTMKQLNITKGRRGENDKTRGYWGCRMRAIELSINGLHRD